MVWSGLIQGWNLRDRASRWSPIFVPFGRLLFYDPEYKQIRINSSKEVLRRGGMYLTRSQGADQLFKFETAHIQWEDQNISDAHGDLDGDGNCTARLELRITTQFFFNWQQQHLGILVHLINKTLLLQVMGKGLIPWRELMDYQTITLRMVRSILEKKHRVNINIQDLSYEEIPGHGRMDRSQIAALATAQKVMGWAFDRHQGRNMQLSDLLLYAIGECQAQLVTGQDGKPYAGGLCLIKRSMLPTASENHSTGNPWEQQPSYAEGVADVKRGCSMRLLQSAFVFSRPGESQFYNKEIPLSSKGAVAEELELSLAEMHILFVSNKLTAEDAKEKAYCLIFEKLGKDWDTIIARKKNSSSVLGDLNLYCLTGGMRHPSKCQDHIRSSWLEILGRPRTQFGELYTLYGPAFVAAWPEAYGQRFVHSFNPFTKKIECTVSQGNCSSGMKHPATFPITKHLKSILNLMQWSRIKQGHGTSLCIADISVDEEVFPNAMILNSEGNLPQESLFSNCSYISGQACDDTEEIPVPLVFHVSEQNSEVIPNRMLILPARTERQTKPRNKFSNILINMNLEKLFCNPLPHADPESAESFTSDLIQSKSVELRFAMFIGWKEKLGIDQYGEAMKLYIFVDSNIKNQWQQAKLFMKEDRTRSNILSFETKIISLIYSVQMFVFNILKEYAYELERKIYGHRIHSLKTENSIQFATCIRKVMALLLWSIEEPSLAQFNRKLFSLCKLAQKERGTHYRYWQSLSMPTAGVQREEQFVLARVWSCSEVEVENTLAGFSDSIGSGTSPQRTLRSKGLCMDQPHLGKKRRTERDLTFAEVCSAVKCALECVRVDPDQANDILCPEGCARNWDQVQMQRIFNNDIICELKSKNPEVMNILFNAESRNQEKIQDLSKSRRLQSFSSMRMQDVDIVQKLARMHSLLWCEWKNSINKVCLSLIDTDLVIAVSISRPPIPPYEGKGRELFYRRWEAYWMEDKIKHRRVTRLEIIWLGLMQNYNKKTKTINLWDTMNLDSVKVQTTKKILYTADLRQMYRLLRACPPGITELKELANLLPIDHFMRNMTEVVSDLVTMFCLFVLVSEGGAQAVKNVADESDQDSDVQETMVNVLAERERQLLVQRSIDLEGLKQVARCLSKNSDNKLMDIDDERSYQNMIAAAVKTEFAASGTAPESEGFKWPAFVQIILNGFVCRKMHLPLPREHVRIEEQTKLENDWSKREAKRSAKRQSELEEQ